MNIHHLGIATNDMKKVKDFITKTHNIIDEKGPIWDPNLKANLMLFEVKEGLSLEIVSGPIVKSLLKKNIFLYHFCYEVNNIEIAIKDLRMQGANLIQKPKPAILFNNRLVSFLMTPLGIVELLNKN